MKTDSSNTIRIHRVGVLPPFSELVPCNEW